MGYAGQDMASAAAIGQLPFEDVRAAALDPDTFRLRRRH